MNKVLMILMCACLMVGGMMEWPEDAHAGDGLMDVSVSAELLLSDTGNSSVDVDNRFITSVDIAGNIEKCPVTPFVSFSGDVTDGNTLSFTPSAFKAGVVHTVDEHLTIEGSYSSSEDVTTDQRLNYYGAKATYNF